MLDKAYRFTYDDNDMHDLLTKAIAAAEEAGARIMELYADAQFESKLDGSPVTRADTDSNEILIRHLHETGIPILSEESLSIATPYPARLWIIDPLDGTKDFLHKTREFSVMIGLIEEGRPILGVVYSPALQTLYYAVNGEGAFVIRDGIKIKLTVSNRVEGNLRYIRSVNNFTPDMERVAHTLNATLHPHGSIGIKSGLLGEDFGDFFFYSGKLGEWDMCAPEIIAIEAGGTVTDFDNNLLTYGSVDHRIHNGVVYSNGACHTNVLEAIHHVQNL